MRKDNTEITQKKKKKPAIKIKQNSSIDINNDFLMPIDHPIDLFTAINEETDLNELFQLGLTSGKKYQELLVDEYSISDELTSGAIISDNRIIEILSKNNKVLVETNKRLTKDITNLTKNFRELQVDTNLKLKLIEKLSINIKNLQQQIASLEEGLTQKFVVAKSWLLDEDNDE